MLDAVVEWVKGLFGDAAEDVVQGVTDSAEETFAGAGDAVADVQDTAGTVADAATGPAAAITDITHDQLGPEN